MEQSKIWDHFQSDEAGLKAFASAPARYGFLARKVRPVERVLNIGVGSGGLEWLLLRRGVDVSCVDPSEQAIQSIQSRLGLSSDEAKVGYAQSLPFQSAIFDRVILSEVLEHLDDVTIEAALREICRVLRPRGILMGTVPAEEDLQENRVVCPDCGKVFHRWGHVQRFGEHQLHDVLASCFDKIKIERTIFGPLATLNWKGRIGWFAKRIALAAGSHGSGENYYFTCVRNRATAP